MLSIPIRNVRNKAFFLWEISSDYAVLYSSSLANKYMPKVSNRNTRIRSKTCSKLSKKKSLRRHWYRSVGFTVNFEHIIHLILVYILLTLTLYIVCFKPVSWYSIYIQAERDYCSSVVIVNFEQITPCSSVSTVDFEHVFNFWVLPFNISTTFKLRWVQVPFIYRKDFLEITYTAPCFFFFFFFFFEFFLKTSKLECVNITFFERHL